MVHRAGQAGLAGNGGRGHRLAIRNELLHTRVVRTRFQFLQLPLFHARLHLRLSDCSVPRVA